MPLNISEEDFQWVDNCLTGAVGPSGMYALDFQSCLLRFLTSLDILREDMVKWAYWLANESPPWAAYHTIISAQMVTLDKCPSVRPVVIGEVCRRLITNLVL